MFGERRPFLVALLTLSPEEYARLGVALSMGVLPADHPAHVMGEAVRILTPGGRVLVLDLREHSEAWVRERLGDRWLGFSPAGLNAILSDAGLIDIKVTVGARRSGDPFTVLIASGVKPARTRKQKRND